MIYYRVFIYVPEEQKELEVCLKRSIEADRRNHIIMYERAETDSCFRDGVKKIEENWFINIVSKNPNPSTLECSLFYNSPTEYNIRLKGALKLFTSNSILSWIEYKKNESRQLSNSKISPICHYSHYLVYNNKIYYPCSFRDLFGEGCIELAPSTPGRKRITECINMEEVLSFLSKKKIDINQKVLTKLSSRYFEFIIYFYEIN